MLNIYLFIDTGVWTQGLHLEPLHQPFCDFWDRVFEQFALASLQKYWRQIEWQWSELFILNTKIECMFVFYSDDQFSPIAICI
jgi:hypothetical protein